MPLSTRTIPAIPSIGIGPGPPALARLVATAHRSQPWETVLITFVLLVSSCAAQDEAKNVSAPAPVVGSELNVNWLYGSYVPKEVPLKPLDGHQRFKLYLLQTYTTPGIYIKTTLFALHDQISESNPQWGDDFVGFVKRLGNRQVQFIIQNSITSSGNAMLGWEPRYDRCRCDGFWPRTRHAMTRNFVTYDRSERSLRPQIMPFLGAFGSSAIASTWEPGNPKWQVRGYQAVVTQVFVGAGINWIGEFAPEIVRVLHKKKKQ
jgi:hypothetical protein